MTNVVKYKTGTKDTLIAAELRSGGDGITNVLDLAASCGGTEATFTNDTIGTTPEDGFLTIVVNGTSYKIPFWADD